MDFHLKQWRDQQHESENRNTAKMPKLLFDPHPKQKQDPSSGSDALPLFEPQLNSKTSNLSAFPDSPTRFPRSTNSTAKTGFVGNTFTISGHSPSTDLLQPNHSSSESKTGNKGLFAAHDEGHKKSDGHMLRHFFD
ncbi:growth-regulating factor 3 isoform X1 [Tripterygium wilfordii]|uniref:Growth-regulating factor 3 isoform X1 n=1 Tax=Tripterygium wilfordii TaxID=458696 RepID=A0A7J7DVU7_TRIWF|nr:growth-regulating factor 3 isoform X1 [Tripterygium wilfordii]